jgi:hypothetical protein
MRARMGVALCMAAAVAAGARLLAAQGLERRQLERIEEALRLEGEAIVALADAEDPQDDPADFAIAWHNDFLKAQHGTFVPFVVTIHPQDVRAEAALLYVRLSRRSAESSGRRGRKRAPSGGEGATYPFEEIYPLDLAPGPTRFTRGFPVAPGDYDLTVVVRERERSTERRRRKAAAVLRRELTVPDFAEAGLTTSTVILADRMSTLSSAPPGEAAGHPYRIGTREVEPAEDARFRPDEELIVVFLVYNPAVTVDKHFDLEVEYHFFRKTGQGTGGAIPVAGGLPLVAEAGETYVNRTEPQRFNPLVLGSEFDPAAGQPVLAGQGVPLSGFQAGEYRLAIRVKDLVSGRAIERQVRFTVGS